MAKDTFLTPLPFQFPESPTLDLSIVIVNFNTRDITLDCLRSIHAHTQDISFEVLVVDNHSEDGSAQAIREDFPEVTLIENEDNRGFSTANNQGLRISKGRYAVLLNSDTVYMARITALADNVVGSIIVSICEHTNLS